MTLGFFGALTDTEANLTTMADIGCLCSDTPHHGR